MAMAPDTYTPAYCQAIQLGCKEKMEAIDSKVNKVDNRVWSLIILAGSNLLASVGGLIFYILTQIENEATIKSLISQINP